MTLALLAALVIVSGYAALQHGIIKRLSSPVALPPLADATEAGEALLEAVATSISEHMSGWEAPNPRELVHGASGFRVLAAGSDLRLFKHRAEITLSQRQRGDLRRALEIGNAREAVAALTPALEAPKVEAE